MKSRNAFAFLIMLLMIAAAFFIGANKGWTNERAKVDAAYASLEEMLNTRVETANNILTVAKRHLPENDASVEALRADRDTLASASAVMAEKAAANTRLTKNAGDVLTALALSETVKADERDQMYVTALLPQMLADSQAYVAQNEYNLAAQEYNERLRTNWISGSLAQIMGLKPIYTFAQDQ